MIKKQSIRTNTAWSVGNYGFSVVSMFFLFPFMIRYLGDSNYGFFIFLGTINGVASIANFGFGEASLRYIALYFNSDDHKSIGRIVSTSFWLYVLLGSVATAVVFLFAGPLMKLLSDVKLDPGQAVFLIRISALTFLIRFVLGIFATIPQAMQRFDISSKIAILETVLRVVLYVMVVLTGKGLKGIVFAEMTVAIVVSLVNLTVSSRLLRVIGIFGKPSLNTFREIYNYSFFSFLTQIVGLAWQYTDRILLGYFIGSAAIAYFSVPQQIIFKILGLVSTAAVVLFPRFSLKEFDSNSKILYKEFTLLSLLFTVIVFSVLSLIIKDFIRLWISADFATGTENIAVILSVSCMIRGAFVVYENLFKGLGKPEYNMFIVIGSSLIIVVVDFLLIPNLGLMGAGIAYLLSPVAGVVTIYLIWKKILKENLREPLKIYLVPLLISYFLLLAALLIKRSINPAHNWINIISEAIAFSSVHVVFLFFYYKIFASETFLRLKEASLKIISGLVSEG